MGHTILHRDEYPTNIFKEVYVHALKGLVLPRASHSSEIALSGSRRLRYALAAAPVLFAHAAVVSQKWK
jgi:hypothetical protein